MNKLIVMGVLAAFLAACLFPCMAITDGAETGDSASAEASEESRSIVVLTDQPMTRSNGYGDDVRFQSTFESISPEDIVVIDGLWIENQDQNTVYGDVKALVDVGNPVLLAADSYDAISTDRLGYSTGFSSSADFYGIMVDPVSGTTYCYSVSDSDDTEAFETALQWVDDCRSETVLARASNSVTAPVLFAVTESRDSFGTTVAESKHTKYTIDDNTALIMTEYNYSADPDTEDSIWDYSISVADMEIRCDHLDSDLLDHGPTSSSSETYVVDIFAEDEESGVSASGSWSYTMKDSELEDKSRNEIFDIFHEIDEHGDDKLSTKVMKPGTISIATKGNNPYLYHETEYYNACFYKDRVALDKYVDCDSDLIVSII